MCHAGLELGLSPQKAGAGEMNECNTYAGSMSDHVRMQGSDTEIKQ